MRIVGRAARTAGDVARREPLKDIPLAKPGGEEGGCTVPELQLDGEFVYGLDYIDEHVAEFTSAGQRRFVIQDANYNVVATTDENNVLHQQYSYEPYGSLFAAEEGWQADPIDFASDPELIESHFGYQGLWRDAETGLYNFRGRDYAPPIGRFLQGDPNGLGLVLVGPLATHGQPRYVSSYMSPSMQYLNGLGLYEFVGSNPNGGLDPSGLETYGGQMVKVSIQAGLIGMVVGGIGGAVGDALFNPDSTWGTRGRGALFGAAGGGFGGAAGAATAAWVGIGGLAALSLGAAVEGGVQSALSGDSAGWVAANAVGGAVLSGIGVGVIGNFIRAWRGAADDAARGAAQAAKAAMAESAGAITMARAGYMELPARLPGDRGFDGVFVKFGPNGEPADIIIVESKYTSSGYASLSQTKNMGQQMSTQWIQANINNMLRSLDPLLRSTGKFLDNYKTLIRRKTNVMGPDGINRWNMLEPPP